MWFKKFRVVNVGPFDDLSVEFTRGSIGIFGKNGRGKSTLLNLMYALLTNDFGRFAGLKAEMVRTTADPKAEAYIQGEVTHGGQDIVVTRNLRPTRAKPGTVVVADGETITDANKANAKIDAVLGIDKKLLDLYVFKSQDKIYDFLTTSATDRAKAYHTLCRTEACDQIWSTLGEFLNKDKESNTEIEDTSDELVQRIAEIETQIAAITEQRATAQESLCSDEAFDKYQGVLAAQAKLEELKEDEAGCVGALPGAREQLAEYEDRLAKREAKLKEFQDWVKENRAGADAARAALKTLGQYKLFKARRKTLRDQADALETEGRREPPDPVTDEELGQLDALNRELARLERDLEHAKKVVASFDRSGVVECPTCGTSVATLEDHLITMREAAIDLPGQIRTLERRIEKIETYKSAAGKYEKWKAGYDARLKANRDALEAMGTMEVPEGDANDLQETVDEFVSAEDKVRDFAEKVAQSTKAVAGTRASVESVEKDLRKIRQALAEVTVTPEKVEKATRRLREHDEAKLRIATLVGEAKGLKKRKEETEAELERLRVKLRRTKRVRKMAAVISLARDVFHHSRLPKRVALVNLGRMEGDINAALTNLGGPFWAEADDSLSFVVHKPGEPPQPAGWLSTGQRVILAMAFWPAVASLWGNDLGMLALDEPTANLDGDNRKLLAQALSVLTAKARGNRQLLMVTHDHDLKTAFDQVVDLGE